MAFTRLIAVLFSLPLLYLAQRLYSTYRNYAAAKRTGLPVHVQPFGVASPTWIFFGGVLKRVFARSGWAHRIDSGWNQRQKLKPYHELGTRAFWIVTPDYRELFVVDPAACEDILKRCRSEFQKNPWQYNILDIYGLNVVTANGKIWERHRRITAPPFNERVSETVWDESARQADGARRRWMEASAAGDVRTTQEDTTRIAFNVLSTAGFGISFDFDDVVGQGPPSGGAAAGGKGNAHHMHYRDALFLLLNDMESLIAWILLNRMGWPEFAMWGGIRAIGEAKREYGTYLHEMIRDEREAIRSGRSTGDQKVNLMSSLIKASDLGADDASSKASAKAGPVLSDDEVAGNLFILNIAGHDTTANALNFAITLLAVEPEWQEWLAEEIDAIVKEDQSSLKYAAVFPKLHRCLAIMYETLRLFGPAPITPRWTAQEFHTLTIDGKEYEVPPDSDIKLDLVSLHHDKETWGEDAEEFRPDRWIPSASSQGDERRQEASRASVGAYDWQSESLVSPAAGTFLPWTGGPRVCPGKKFSQVEFTSVLLRLFRGGARVRIAEEDGESPEQARARAREIASDPTVSITLKMQGSKKIGLKWYVKDE